MPSISAGHQRMVCFCFIEIEWGVLRSKSNLMFLDKQADIRYATVLLRRSASGVIGTKDSKEKNCRIFKRKEHQSGKISQQTLEGCQEESVKEGCQDGGDCSEEVEQDIYGEERQIGQEEGINRCHGADEAFEP